MSAHKLPNGPQTHPWVQTYKWLTNPLEYMEDCAKRYGDMFTLRIGPFLLLKSSLAILKQFSRFLPQIQNS